MARIAPIDRTLADEVLLEFTGPGGGKVRFQFPPSIPSHGRKGHWSEHNVPGTEPVAEYEKSGPTEITLTWFYIVGADNWTTTDVADQVKLVRGYFARTRSLDQRQSLVINFRMWLHGDPVQSISCRMVGMDAKHSEQKIVPCIQGRPEPRLAYPLRTDITVDLRIWTKSAVEGETVQDITSLRQIQIPSWY